MERGERKVNGGQPYVVYCLNVEGLLTLSDVTGMPGHADQFRDMAFSDKFNFHSADHEVPVQTPISP